MSAKKKVCLTGSHCAAAAAGMKYVPSLHLFSGQQRNWSCPRASQERLETAPERQQPPKSTHKRAPLQRLAAKQMQAAKLVLRAPALLRRLAAKLVQWAFDSLERLTAKLVQQAFGS